MRKGYRKCICCEEWFDSENEGYFAELGSEEGKPLCESCYHQDSEDAQVIIWWDEGEAPEKYLLGGYTLSGNEDESMRPEVWEYARSVTYHRSNAWRGQYEGKPAKGWIFALDTWFGTIDGANMEEKDELFNKKLSEGGEAPCPIIVGFLRTSNCCSCGLEVLIKKEDQEKFEEWLLK